MYKKVLATITATLMVITMAMAPATTAFATENEGDLTTPIYVNEESTPQERIADSVTTDKGDTAVYAEGENANVTVNDEVNASGVRVSTETDGSISYTGATAVSANDGATVTVGSADEPGNVTGVRAGVSAHDEGTTVTVNGNVTATGSDHTVMAWNSETGAYDTPTNTVRGTAVMTEGDGDILIDGDVSGITGINVTLDNDDVKGSITITGTVSSTGNALSIMNPPVTTPFNDLADVMDDLPTITVYELNGGVWANAYTKDSNNQSQVISGAQQEILSAINYIIKEEDPTVTQYGLTVYGENLSSLNVNSQTYKTVHTQQSFEVIANDIPDTYTIDNCKGNVRVEELGDGKFRLTLTNLAGGINIKAVLRPVAAPVVEETTNNDKKPEPVYEVQIEEVTPVVTDATQSTTGVVAVTTAAADATPDVAAISGDKAAKTVAIDLGKVTPVQYRETVISNVATAPANGAFNITTDRVSYFDKNMIEAIASRPDIDVNVVFVHNGVRYKVVIPAGYNVKTLLDANGFCGYLRLLDLLGGTTL